MVIVITVIYCGVAEDIGNHNDMTNGVRFGRKCFCAIYQLCCAGAGIMNITPMSGEPYVIYKWTSSVMYFRHAGHI